MGYLETLRNMISKSLDDVQSAEIVYKDVTSTIDDEIKTSRHRIVNQDDNLEETLLRLKARSQTTLVRSQRILTTLRLDRMQPAQYSMNQWHSIQDALTHIQSLVEISESMLQDMTRLEQQLIEERKKWWKFW